MTMTAAQSALTILAATLPVDDACRELERSAEESSGNIRFDPDTLRELVARTAAEGALKVKEIAYLFAEGLPAGELKHGPLALVEEGFPVVALSTSRALLPKMAGALAEVKARGARVALLSQYEEALADPAVDFPVRLPALCERLMPVLSVIPLQHLACRLCLLRGFDPDRPRNLAKSVTVE